MGSSVSHCGQAGKEHLHREVSTENVIGIHSPGEQAQSEKKYPFFSQWKFLSGSNYHNWSLLFAFLHYKWELLRDHLDHLTLNLWKTNEIFLFRRNGLLITISFFSFLMEIFGFLHQHVYFFHTNDAKYVKSWFTTLS